MTRTTSPTRACNACRFWSDQKQQPNHQHGKEAVCMNPNSPKVGTYTDQHFTCEQWRHGPEGAVDQLSGNPYLEDVS